MSPATFGASARWLRRSRWARRSLAGVAVVGVGVLTWHGLTGDRLPDLTAYEDTAARKAAFFGFLLPHVRAVNAGILADRERLRRIRTELAGDGSAGFFDERWVRTLAGDYGLDPPAEPDVAFVDRLLRRVDIIAPSLVLAQAANESAWGTSRFARHGNNLFGLRTHDGSGLVPRRRASGRRFTVAAYDSVRDSVDDYVHNLNTHPRYRRLRQIRVDLRRAHRAVSGYALANGLGAYSKRGADYIAIIQSMISSNRLGQYDE